MSYDKGGRGGDSGQGRGRGAHDYWQSPDWEAGLWADANLSEEKKLWLGVVRVFSDWFYANVPYDQIPEEFQEHGWSHGVEFGPVQANGLASLQIILGMWFIPFREKMEGELTEYRGRRIEFIFDPDQDEPETAVRALTWTHVRLAKWKLLLNPRLLWMLGTTALLLARISMRRWLRRVWGILRLRMRRRKKRRF